MTRYKIQNTSALLAGLIFLIIFVSGMTEEQQKTFFIIEINLILMLAAMGIPSYTFYKKQRGFKYVENDSLFANIASAVFLIGIAFHLFL